MLKIITNGLNDFSIRFINLPEDLQESSSQLVNVFSFAAHDVLK